MVVGIFKLVDGVLLLLLNMKLFEDLLLFLKFVVVFFEVLVWVILGFDDFVLFVWFGLEVLVCILDGIVMLGGVIYLFI